MKHYDRAWAEIDLDALLFNIESIQEKIASVFLLKKIRTLNSIGQRPIPL